MKNAFKLVFGALLAMGAALPAAAITLGFAPSSQSVSVGSTTTVDLVISGLGDGAAPSLGGFDLDVGYDPLVLGFSGAALGDPLLGDQLDLLGLGSFQIVDASVGGTVNLYEISLDSVDDLNDLQAPSFVLVRLSFNGLASGSSTLSLPRTALADASGRELDAEIVGGTIESIGSVSAVPEPASLPLLGIGMLSLIALALRGSKPIKAC